MTAKSQATHETDSVSDWIAEANQEFFGQSGSVGTGTVKKAVIGFVVLAIGLGTIIWQALT